MQIQVFLSGNIPDSDGEILPLTALGTQAQGWSAIHLDSSPAREYDLACQVRTRTAGRRKIVSSFATTDNDKTFTVSRSGTTLNDRHI